jgi:hypothetical protein
MSRVARICLCLTPALSIAGFAAAPAAARSNDMFPLEISKQLPADYADYLADMDEPRLWKPKAAKGFRTRIWFSISGIVLARASIRIDERENGKITGHLAMLDYERGSRGAGVVTETRFSVTRQQFEDLQRQIAQSALWSIYPEFYNGDPNDICVNGEEIILERVDAKGYRFSTANAQCTAPAEILAIAAMIADLAKATRVKGWLG